MRRTYKYRIYANKQTIANAECWIELCRQLYNAALEQRIVIYKQNKGQISCYQQMKQLTDAKAYFNEYNKVGTQVLQEVLQRLDRSYKSYFRRVKNNEKPGFPRFKSISRYNSFTLKRDCWNLDGKHLKISRIGTFKLRLSRDIQGTIKTITICRDSIGHWYACFLCDFVPEKVLPKIDKSVGIDVGIKSFCFDSDGVKFDNPNYFRYSEGQLCLRQRRLSRRVKWSNRRNKARVLAAKTHEYIKDQRRDFLHKTANYYIQNYDQIYVEDLAIKNMVRNHNLAKSISDASWGTFFEFLVYKAECAGRSVSKVNPRNTSQICSGCGELVPKKLKDRVHACPNCGLVLDRDHNAAINIREVGQTSQALTCASRQSVACVSQAESAKYILIVEKLGVI